MEFHISRKARERYRFAESLFSYSGNVIFASVAACREFAYRMNTVRDVERHPERAVHAGQLYAMGLIDEASHALMARYREQYDPAVFTQALEWFSGQVGREALGRMLLIFVEEFPGLEVMRGELTAQKWLAGATDGTSHWAVAMEEMLLLWTANRNEAFKPFEELFEEKTLAERTVYKEVTRQFPEYFATRPLIPVSGAKQVSLLELLRAPAMGAPRSLGEQLKLIRSLWKPLLGESLDHFLEIAAEILHEEELAIWMQFNPAARDAQEAARRHRESGDKQWPGMVSTAEVPSFGDPAHEYEKFSPDMAWMPTAVMIAKSTYVWLAQLSRQYGRAIRRLDEIPDEELAVLAARGLNTLWLIGIWERSRASRTIKQLCGNTDAVASAYSLFDYTIADDLGGEAAYVKLRDRSYHHGIRLASDMVPNHMGIDSPWVVKHPDWFIARQESPYPAYSFNGPNLSQDGRVEIKIEDHYYSESDAAVVFRRRDQQSNEVRYIYHGNDGTSFPWNDTAQLDYLNPAVREQVIQTILHVARLFPVIRFDAAMTLAKRHFHRLWFPGPGASGAIPSRAEYGMSQAEFDRAMPQEFWREVVDRVAAEVPGTLLLAEAFWLMEGYFVRTLGMHRVYNSAFMVMLRDEDNAKYREVIKKTIEFDADILKRYVNFMSNPDERTAIDQFGKGDKCFGVAAMMATLPGLPMFGHGQIEGFTEKYGMEYQRPRYEENADPWMVERHQREIAPLLKRRRLFAESDNFLLYDFFVDAGTVDENVFAYSNLSGGERALVVFNNRYGETRGTIDWSAAYADKGSNQLRQKRLREGLGLSEDAGRILAWRDSLTGLEYLRRASEVTEGGLRLELHAYECRVLLDWRELTATATEPWDRLCDQLKGRGVASLEDAMTHLELEPAHDALRLLLEPGLVRGFADLAEHPRTVAGGGNPEIEAERAAYFETVWARCESFLRSAQKAYIGLMGAGVAEPANPGLLRAAYRERLRAAMRIPATEMLFTEPWTAAARRMLPCPSPQLTATAMWGPVLGWCALELLAASINAEHPASVALELFDRLRLREPFAQVFNALGYEGEEGWRVAARMKVVLLTMAGVGRPETSATAEAAADERVALEPVLWLDADVRWLCGVHEAEGHEYLIRERYEELLWWLLMPALLRLAGENGFGLAAANRTAARTMGASIAAALKTAESAGYRVDLLLKTAETEEVSVEAAAEVEPAIEGVALSVAKPVEVKAVDEPSVAASDEAATVEQQAAEPEALVEAVADEKEEAAVAEKEFVAVDEKDDAAPAEKEAAEEEAVELPAAEDAAPAEVQSEPEAEVEESAEESAPALEGDSSEAAAAEAAEPEPEEAREEISGEIVAEELEPEEEIAAISPEIPNDSEAAEVAHEPENLAEASAPETLAVESVEEATIPQAVAGAEADQTEEPGLPAAAATASWAQALMDLMGEVEQSAPPAFFSSESVEESAPAPAVDTDSETPAVFAEWPGESAEVAATEAAVAAAPEPAIEAVPETVSEPEAAPWVFARIQETSEETPADEISTEIVASEEPVAVWPVSPAVESADEAEISEDDSFRAYIAKRERAEAPEAPEEPEESDSSSSFDWAGFLRKFKSQPPTTLNLSARDEVAEANEPLPQEERASALPAQEPEPYFAPAPVAEPEATPAAEEAASAADEAAEAPTDGSGFFVHDLPATPMAPDLAAFLEEFKPRRSTGESLPVVRQAIPSMNEPWEPEAPLDVFSVRQMIEIKPEAVKPPMARPSMTEPWEPEPPQIDFLSKPPAGKASRPKPPTSDEDESPEQK